MKKQKRTSISSNAVKIKIFFLSAFCKISDPHIQIFYCKIPTLGMTLSKAIRHVYRWTDLLACKHWTCKHFGITCNINIYVNIADSRYGPCPVLLSSLWVINYLVWSRFIPMGTFTRVICTSALVPEIILYLCPCTSDFHMKVIFVAAPILWNLQNDNFSWTTWSSDFASTVYPNPPPAPPNHQPLMKTFRGQSGLHIWQGSPLPIKKR